MNHPPLKASRKSADLHTQAITALVGLDTQIANEPATRRTSLDRALTALEGSWSTAGAGITPATDRTALALATDRRDHAVQTARALDQARRSAADQQRTSTALAEIHRELLRRTQIVHAGRLRAHHLKGSPPPEEIPAHLAALDAATERPGMTPIATIAQASSYLGWAEPYAHDNARLARTAATYLVTRWNITSTIVLPVSENTEELHAAHQQYLADHDLDSLSDALAAAILTGLDTARRMVADLLDLAEIMHSQLSGVGARADSCAWSILDYLLGSPVTSNGAAGRAAGADRISGWNAANKLAEAGILSPIPDKNLWQAPDVLSVWAKYMPEDAHAASLGA